MHPLLIIVLRRVVLSRPWCAREARPDVIREPYVWPRRQRRSRVTSTQAPNRSSFLQDAIDILGDRWTYLVLVDERRFLC
jgi:hypothetical protein